MYSIMFRRDSRAARLRVFLASDPSNEELALALADELAVDGQPLDAISVLQAHPAAQTPSFKHLSAQLALSAGDYTLALQWLDDLRLSAGRAPAIDHDRAFALLCLGRLDAARQEIDAAVEAHGPLPALLLLRARLSMLEGSPEQAVDALKALEREQPLDAQAAGVLALALFDQGNDAEAAARATQALDLQAFQHEALLVLSAQALSQRLPEEAIAGYQRALQTHPGSGRALSGLGQAQMMLGDLVAGEATLQLATRAMPEHIGTWHALAWSQLLQGRRDDARSSFEQAYAIDRTFGDTHAGLALVHALKGETAQAEDALKRAKRLSPESMTARYVQEVLLGGQGRASSAEQSLMELLQTTGIEAGIPMPVFADALASLLSGRPTSRQ
ncbi:tetratricopeptide repeat protein [Stenotrophomonas sp. SPM]|uniref:tetratricopeptide repeat protein n=1 Tax=Stenotrophomonas sp. SPM TaxID=2170735 RepID=UPI0014024B7E|nr:tetratricopeptide repeat protein [Stenotrophomonas sp. SPM]